MFKVSFIKKTSLPLSSYWLHISERSALRLQHELDRALMLKWPSAHRVLSSPTHCHSPSTETLQPEKPMATALRNVTPSWFFRRAFSCLRSSVLDGTEHEPWGKVQCSVASILSHLVHKLFLMQFVESMPTHSFHAHLLKHWQHPPCSDLWACSQVNAIFQSKMASFLCGLLIWPCLVLWLEHPCIQRVHLSSVVVGGQCCSLNPLYHQCPHQYRAQESETLSTSQLSWLDWGSCRSS